VFVFGVDTFIWSVNFSEKDLWIIPKVKELGFTPLDIAVVHPEKFLTQKVKDVANEIKLGIRPEHVFISKVKKTGISPTRANSASRSGAGFCSMLKSVKR